MKVIILTVLLLAGCTQESEKVSLKISNPVVVHFELLETAIDVDVAYKSLTRSADSIGFEKLNKGRRKGQRQGFHYYRNGECYLVLIKPNDVSLKEFEKILGHEMTHCLFGSYHDSSGKMPSKVIL